MSLGYWLGGKETDKDAQIDELANILLFAALFIWKLQSLKLINRL